jgi:hypothetical protein
MKIIETKVYNFDELPKDIQQKVLEKNAYINVSYDWWEFTYEDAERIGLKIKGFDIDRGNYCEGEFTLSANEVAQNIFNEHGKDCETFKTATKFMEEWQPVFNEYMDENSEKFESRESEDKLQDLEDEFLKDICEDYKIILRNEYEYQTSEEAIIETIEANEYTFTIEGKMMNS